MKYAEKYYREHILPAIKYHALKDGSLHALCTRVPAIPIKFKKEVICYLQKLGFKCQYDRGWLSISWDDNKIKEDF